MRGFNDANGSWNTICIRRRNRRSAAPVSAVMSSPSNRTDPAVGSISLKTSRAVVLLPHPLSPTSASVSPRPSVNEMPSTARTAPTWRENTMPRRIG